MPEEVRFFARLAGYGVLIAVVYWFVSYEVAGTVLLVAFGIATGFATLILLRDVRRRRRSDVRRPLRDWIALTDTADDEPFLDEPAGVPRGSIAPLEFGFGAAVAALGLVFGTWLVALGLVPIVIGASVWIREAMTEHRGVRLADADETAIPGYESR